LWRTLFLVAGLAAFLQANGHALGQGTGAGLEQRVSALELALSAVGGNSTLLVGEGSISNNLGHGISVSSSVAMIERTWIERNIGDGIFASGISLVTLKPSAA